jgi:hypothetical protein
MSRRQKHFTPNIPDRQFNEMVNMLKNDLGYDRDSDLFTYAITKLHNEVMARRRKLKP